MLRNEDTMNYDENLFKEKANIKARRIWLAFALLLSANYGSDVPKGLYPTSSYLVFLALCWTPLYYVQLLLLLRLHTYFQLQAFLLSIKTESL